MHGEPATNWNEIQNDLSRGAAQADQHTYRRSSKRVYYNAKVLFSNAAEINTGKVKNLSAGGAAIQSPERPAIGDVLIISIPFTKKEKKVRRRAIVRWASGDIFGIEFI